jgi:hypothetical protein
VFNATGRRLRESRPLGGHRDRGESRPLGWSPGPGGEPPPWVVTGTGGVARLRPKKGNGNFKGDASVRSPAGQSAAWGTADRGHGSTTTPCPDAPALPSWVERGKRERLNGYSVRRLRCSKVDEPLGGSKSWWEMLDVRLDQQPWSSVTLGKGESFVCPGCRRPILMHTRKEPPSAAAFAPWEHLSPGSSRKPKG